jgi:hypothetical protein
VTKKAHWDRLIGDFLQDVISAAVQKRAQ